ncbi:hypothetical protein [Neptuniibacter caesariensis]|uniref:Uncharacterized protein n=1 Tax=Neptuniibacter caesariensis TaxID=207954 RepID=A0A7U8GRE1_NEPCE|nr:hypothetical protein [Neptuniibacter caesariensis]EAR61272.1 hypothetical protein MED92_11114 [Oceanospirillum sp. MED92] [Neptuniibacter caesariensis]
MAAYIGSIINNLILDTIVKNNRGELEKGIYKVDLNGGHTKLFSLDFDVNFKYCYADGVLKVWTERVENLENVSVSGIKIYNEALSYKLPPGKQHSFSHCELKDSIEGYAIYYLNNGEYIKSYRSKSTISTSFKSNKGDVYLVDENGNEIDIGIKKGYLTDPEYVGYKNAYFGYRLVSRCGHLWWLYTEGWDSENEKLCFGEWSYSGGSITITPIRDGLFLEHHTTSNKKAKAYVYVNNREYKVEKNIVRGAVSSPDGCKVAYGFGDFNKIESKLKLRQYLKVFDSCKYIKSNDFLRFNDGLLKNF